VPQRRPIQPQFVPAICVLLGVLFALRQYLMMVQKGEPISWSQAFFDQLPYWVLWAILSPLILLLVRRFPIQRRNWVQSLPVHVLAAALLGLAQPLVYLLISLALDGWQSSKPAPLTKETFRTLLVFSLIPGMVFYGVILAINLAFNYYEESQQERLTASQLRAQLAEARLQALRMQLHPHFLFNTLHSITALVLKTDNRGAVRMIDRLSALLRHTLEDTETQEVPLRQELEFLKLYLDIESIRFEDRLEVQMHIDSQTLDAKVPNLLLQPLVENAVRHGIAQHSSAGRIEVNARRQDGRLCLEVRDDGPGLPKEWNDGTSRRGIGLKNTKDRLEQLYGEGYEFRLSNNEGGGASVMISFPYQITQSAGD
jgi:two-component system, LytTR family, sensor kinase